MSERLTPVLVLGCAQTRSQQNPLGDHDQAPPGEWITAEIFTDLGRGG